MLGFPHFMNASDLQQTLATVRKMRSDLRAQEKQAFMPMPPDMQQMQAQGGPPQGMPPGMDPSQMPSGMPPGGAPPQGGMMPPGMDPSMMGGPQAMGSGGGEGMPPGAGGPPPQEDTGAVFEQVLQSLQEIAQVLQQQAQQIQQLEQTQQQLMGSLQEPAPMQAGVQGQDMPQQ